jgi:hypothetical protein
MFKNSGFENKGLARPGLSVSEKWTMLYKAIVCDDEAATRFQGMKNLVQHSLVV